MSCIWKSQDLLGPPVGPIGPEEHVSRPSALETDAEHKRKESALLDSSYQATLTTTSSSLSPMGRQSSSPFFGGLAGHPEDLLARLQDACLAGGAIPEFSFAPRQASTTAFASSRTLRSSLSSDDAPIFGLTDDLAKTIVSSPLPHSTGPLRFSTGTFLMPKATSHRRTRSHFYTTGEAPIFATGNELEDDDESSDEEDNSELAKQQDSIEDPSNAVFQLDTVPIIKATPDAGPLKAEPTLAAAEASPLALKPPTFASSLTASSNSIASSQPNDSSKPQHKCNKAGDNVSTPSTAPKVETPPEAPFRFEDLINSPFTGGSQDSLEYAREKEWKALELQVEESYNKPDAHDEFGRRCACASHNLGKNRYPNVLALDSTRVHLTPTEPTNCNYINANFVRGASDSVYISAQAPLPNTFGDFWRMVWEQKVHIIVMLTRLIEDGRPKAHKYWPTTKTRVFGGKYKVTMVNWADSEADFRIKEFELECDGERRRIFQFHYRGWPDHGVPTSPDSLLRMTRSVDAHLEDLRQHPFAEGPSPRPPASYPPGPHDERSSLTSSCSGSVTSNGERRSLEEPEPLSAVQQQQYGIVRRSSSSQFTVSSSILGGSSGTPTSPKWSSSPTVPPRRAEESRPENIVRANDSLFAATSNPSSRSASQLATRNLRPSTPSMVTGSPSAATPPASVASRNGDGPSTHGQDLSPPSRREFRSTSPVSSPSSDAWLEYSSHSTHTTSSLSSTASSLTSNPASVASSVVMSASSSSSSHLSVPAGHPFAAQNAFAMVSPPAGSGSTIASTASTTAPSNAGATPIPAPDRTGEYKIGPMLVHCSAGIGRSGAFIIIHSVLERIAASGQPVTDITLFHLLKQMRESRAGLVPHQNQYDFCYTAIEHSLQVKRIAHELASGGGPSLREHTSGKARQALQSSTLNRSSHRVPYISNDPPF